MKLITILIPILIPVIILLTGCGEYKERYYTVKHFSIHGELIAEYTNVTHAHSGEKWVYFYQGEKRITIEGDGAYGIYEQ